MVILKVGWMVGRKAVQSADLTADKSAASTVDPMVHWRVSIPVGPSADEMVA